MSPLGVTLLLAAAAPSPELLAAHFRARSLSASAHAQSMRWEMGSTIRAVASIPMLFFGRRDEAGLALSLRPQIALSNDALGPVPWQYWRGRAGLGLEWRGGLGEGLLRLDLAAEHQSSHASEDDAFSPFGPGATLGPGRPRVRSPWYYRNDLALTAELAWPLGPHLLSAGLTQRVHVASCTLDGRCWAVDWAPGYSVGLDVVLEARALEGAPGPRPFAALGALFVPPVGELIEERRLVARAGYLLPSSDAGAFQLYISGRLGHRPGYLRDDDTPEWLLGLGWAP